VISFVPRCHDGAGHRSRKPRLPEGVSGIARLHALVGRFLPEDVDGAAVKIGIETDRGPWVAALVPARATVSREPRAMPVMLLSRRPGRDRLPPATYRRRGQRAGRRGEGSDTDAPGADLGAGCGGA
jgi:hypothetical protein